MTYKYYARLIGPNNELRDFEIIDYSNGLYMVYIDFIFPMILSRVIVKA
jgi:hypothetical protein